MIPSKYDLSRLWGNLTAKVLEVSVISTMGSFYNLPFLSSQSSMTSWIQVCHKIFILHPFNSPLLLLLSSLDHASYPVLFFGDIILSKRNFCILNLLLPKVVHNFPVKYFAHFFPSRSHFFYLTILPHQKRDRHSLRSSLLINIILPLPYKSLFGGLLLFSR